MKLYALILALILVVGLPMACGEKEEAPEAGGPEKAAVPEVPDEPDVPDTPKLEGATLVAKAKAIMEASCVECHGVEKVTDAKMDRGGWAHQVEMCSGDVPLEEDDLEALLDYLAENHGP